MLDQSMLVRIVHDGLEDAAPKLVTDSGWADLIGDYIEERLQKELSRGMLK